MAVTRIYSTLNFIISALVAILLGFCPKFGALIGTIPGGIIGGLAVVLFGLTIGGFTIGGIGVATFGSIIMYQILRERTPQPEEAATAASAVGPFPEPEAGAGE
jgi:putative pyrimidine permease RutG